MWLLFLSIFNCLFLNLLKPCFLQTESQNIDRIGDIEEFVLPTGHSRRER